MRQFYSVLYIVFFFNVIAAIAQQESMIQLNDSTKVSIFSRGTELVNKCTPLDHLKCVYITGVEVIEDGLQGKATRHWWRKSYIGRACTEQYGNTFGNVFEGFFAVPHYFMIAVVNGTTWVISLFIPNPEKKAARIARRKARRDARKKVKLIP